MGIAAEEAARRLRVSRSRIYQLIREGRLRGEKPGGRDWVIDEASLAQEEARERRVGYPRGRPRRRDGDEGYVG